MNGMKMITRCCLVALGCGLLQVGALAAEEYTVTLVNGATFKTRYKPMTAAWDDTKVMLLTEVGNWIALERQDITGVSSSTEARGFGTVIDTATVVLGWAPNNNPVPSEENAAPDPMAQYLDFLRGQAASRQDFSVQQFAEPDEAGRGGLPAYGLAPDLTSPAPNGMPPPPTSFPRAETSNAVTEPGVIEN